MSTSRCGLQVARTSILTYGNSEWPRSKQVLCLETSASYGNRPDDMNRAALNPEVVTEQMEDDLLTIKKKFEEQKGTGVIDFVSRATKKFKRGAETLAAAVSNAFPDADKNARPIYPGEHHAIGRLPGGKYARMSYTGPGTQIVKRLKRGDPPRVMSDKVSKAHDIRYSLANDEDDVRSADQKMVRKLKQLQRDNLDNIVNIQPAMKGIQGKMALENFSLLDRNKFVDYKPLSSTDRSLLQGELNVLEQQGFGTERRLRSPGSYLSTSSRGVEQTYYGIPHRQLKGPIVDTSRLIPLVERLAKRGFNTPGKFVNRQFATKSSPNIDVSTGSRNKMLQRGGAQVPGEAAPASSQKIKVSTKGQYGGNWPGVGMVDVQRGAQRGGALPGQRLLGKMRKKVSARASSRPSKKKKRYPLYMDDYDMAGMLANKLAPLVYSF